MTENNEVMQEEQEEVLSKNNENQPILPDAEYAAMVAEEDAEELEKARKRLMLLLYQKCGNLGKSVLDGQLKPMVYSMSISDCNNMYDVISKHGVMGLMRMSMKHNREEKKANKG